jgi:hypothetical protein
VSPPSPECIQNAADLSEKVELFRQDYEWVNTLFGNPDLHFFVDAVPGSVSGVDYAGARANPLGESYGPALPKNAFRGLGSIGSRSGGVKSIVYDACLGIFGSYVYIGRFGSTEQDEHDEYTEYIFKNAQDQFFIVGSTVIARCFDNLHRFIPSTDLTEERFEGLPFLTSKVALSRREHYQECGGWGYV